MKSLLTTIALGCALLTISTTAFGQAEPAMDDAQIEAAIAAYLEALDFQQGLVKLAAANAELEIPSSFQFLGAEQTEDVLVNLWGNPPGSNALGMLVPSDSSLVDADSWAIIVSYEEDGYVSDEDANSIDYDDLLQSMQTDTASESKQRAELGYGTIELLGWAEAPHYDAAEHKMYWAKELVFEGSEQNTLNYNIRVLGRKGVLVLNAVASSSQLADVDARMPEVLAFTNFSQGNRYEDFNPATDKVAAYGLAALVAGGLAAKTGLLAKLGVFLLAFKKFGVIIVIAIVGLFSKLIGRKKGATEGQS